jgi:hypothetical protein
MFCNMNSVKLFSLVLVFVCFQRGIAQENIPADNSAESPALMYSVRAGINIGGTTPMNMPASIRGVESYSPGVMPVLGGEAYYRLHEKIGIDIGLYLEQKGMFTEAKVKNYFTTFQSGDEHHYQEVTGYYTGTVATRMRHTYLTVPLHISYWVGENYRIKAGLFASCLLHAKFEGTAQEGYIRDMSPVGQKIGIANARYDFSDDVKSLNTGIDIGLDYYIKQHFLATAHLQYGVSSVMRSSFKSIDFDMYHLYLGLQIGYRF